MTPNQAQHGSNQKTQSSHLTSCRTGCEKRAYFKRFVVRIIESVCKETAHDVLSDPLRASLCCASKRLA